MSPAELKLFVVNPSLKDWPLLLGAGIFFLGTGVIGLALLIFSFSTALIVAAIGLALMTWPALQMANTEYIVTNLRVCVSEGFFRKSGWEVPVREIREIRVVSGRVQQALGIGDLEIVCAGGVRRLGGIEAPEKVRGRIMSLV